MAANLKFVAIAADEADAVQVLARRIWYACYPEIISTAQIDYMLARMYDPARIREEIKAGIAWEWAVVNGKRLGYLSYACDSTSGQAWLHKIYLVPEAQGKGWGQRCLAHFAEVATAARCNVFVLHVNKRNQRAIRAYEKFGFRIAEAVVTDIGAGFVMDDYRMECDLPLSRPE